MNNNQFNYTYSAPEQNEIKKIREKYLIKDESSDKLTKLRKLDKSAEAPGKIAAITLGIIGTLLLGIGMCFVMVWTNYVPGIIIGVLGIVILSVAYPVYKTITKIRRQIVAPEILKLTDELEK